MFFVRAIHEWPTYIKEKTALDNVVVKELNAEVVWLVLGFQSTYRQKQSFWILMGSCDRRTYISSRYIFANMRRWMCMSHPERKVWLGIIRSHSYTTCVPDDMIYSTLPATNIASKDRPYQKVSFYLPTIRFQRLPFFALLPGVHNMLAFTHRNARVSNHIVESSLPLLQRGGATKQPQLNHWQQIRGVNGDIFLHTFCQEKRSLPAFSSRDQNWSPKWRSLNPCKGHLKHPKRSLGSTWWM